jgi:hypothetical protein
MPRAYGTLIIFQDRNCGGFFTASGEGCATHRQHQHQHPTSTSTPNVNTNINTQHRGDGGATTSIAKENSELWLPGQILFVDGARILGP